MLLPLIHACATVATGSPVTAQSTQGHVYVVLWFDTEDYILPQSDDAAKRVAELLTKLGVRATFKVVGEKARMLEKRGRNDVIAALRKHEIGYHANTHSQHPTPAEYEESLDWATGVAEFTRREKGGFDDVARIFGQQPSCYGQPGSSWAPQSFEALKQWGVHVYLDEASQVGLEGKPFYYGGLLNIFNTREGGQLRANHHWSNLPDARKKFADYYRTMTATGGGIVSIFFHPCEFIHKEFWDGVNFAHGANPPREEWKLPPMQPPAEQERRFKFLEELVGILKEYPQVRFVTASEALKLYEDRAQGRSFSNAEIAEIAEKVGAEVGFQRHGEVALAPSEIFALLADYVARAIDDKVGPVTLERTPYGPSSAFLPAEAETGRPREIGWSQFARSVKDAADYIHRNGRIPSEVWAGSQRISPEQFLRALASATHDLLAEHWPPKYVMLQPAALATTRYVADDKPSLWGWVIFPEGFHAPNLMHLAKLQAWTLKPAILHDRATVRR